MKVSSAVPVGDPLRFRLIPVRAHKGYCLAEIVIQGVEGHSAYPETGASAILAAGRVLRELERLGKELEADSDPLFAPPFTTLNVGLIQGGKAKNVIAGGCTITLEWRPLPRQDRGHVLRLVEEACAKLSGGRIAIEVKPQRFDEGVSVPRDAAFARMVMSSGTVDCAGCP